MSAPVLLAASHGTSDPAGRRAVAALVAAVTEAAPELEVRAAFVDVEEPDVPSSLARLGDARPVVIVPLLLSAGYHVRTDLARDAREAAPARVTVAAALGPDPRLLDLLGRRLAESGCADADRLVLAAAGSSDARAVADCTSMGQALAARLGRPVETAFVSAAEPRVPVAVACARAAGSVAVVSYLLAPGYFAGLVRELVGDRTTEPLLRDGGEVPSELVSIVLDRFRAACNADVSGGLQAVGGGVTRW